MMTRIRWMIALLAIGFDCILLHAPRTIMAEDWVERFEAKIRPLLVEHCYECHSGSSKKLQAGLRLDHRQFLLDGGESGPAFNVGNVDESLLLKAVRYESFEMPPKGKLSSKEIEILREWLAAGAPWPNEPIPERRSIPPAFDLLGRKEVHWAWKKRSSVSVPHLDDPTWSSNPIDRFVMDKLLAANLAPNGEAERSVLIRRAYLDLIGIPPSVEQLEEHLKDLSESWYEGMVDRLLASPQLGVRFGRHWLDLVRYAESRGHEFDEDVPGAIHYRDYVVRAINEDLPYDQFLTEQIAGDLLPNPRRNSRGWNESVLGTGFWHLGEWVHSPVDSRKDEVDRFDNMIDVFSKSMLGLTVACARCHDHKFDAIGTTDYYALFGFLQSSHYRMVRFETDLDHQQVEENRFAISRRGEERLMPLLREIADELLKKEGTRSELQRPMDLLADRWNAGEQLSNPLPSSDTSVLVDYRDRSTLYLNDGPGFGNAAAWANQIDFDLAKDGIQIRVHPFGEAHADPFWRRLKTSLESTNLKNRYAQISTSGRSLITPTFTLDNDKLSYLVRGDCRVFAVVDSMRLLAGPLHGETYLESKSNQGDRYRWVMQNLGRYRGKRIHLEFSPVDDHPLEVVQIISGTPPEKTSIRYDGARLIALLKDWLREEQRSRSSSDKREMGVELAAILEDLGRNLDRYLDANHPLSRRWRESLTEIDRELTKLRMTVRWNSAVAMGMIDGSGEDDCVLVRGNPESPGPKVPRRFLQALDSSPIGTEERGSGRLRLAREVTQSSNPLTARVAVNRIWHHLMGRGIVPTTDDFGVQGQPPSHPELLDYLADRLIEKEWSLKAMLREILLSKTYRMSSQVNPKGLDQDPDNRWLSRRRIRRLEAEALRDTLFAITDSLDLRLEGSSVPVHLTDFLQGRGRPGKSGPEDGDGRRSIYIAVRRNFLVPMMTTFDTPVPFSAMGRRNVSNVPAQSLMLLNDPMVHQLTSRWSEGLLKMPIRESERLQFAFRKALSREASESEQEMSMKFLSHRMGQGDSPQQAWQHLLHVVLNMKELILRF